MCTITNGKTKENFYAYKVVVNSDGKLQSPIKGRGGSYIWKKGINKAYKSYFDYNSSGINETKKPYTFGEVPAFEHINVGLHLCPTIKSAIEVAEWISKEWSYNPKNIKILKVKVKKGFLGRNSGMNTYESGNLDGTPAIVTDKCHWDGETVYSIKGNKLKSPF